MALENIEGNFTLVNGTTYKLKEVRNLVPYSSIHPNKEHYNTCIYLASVKDKNQLSDFEKVYCNLISFHSEIAKIITALIILDRHTPIKEIDSNIIDNSAKHLFNSDIILKYTNSLIKNHIHKSTLKRLLGKAIFNWLYLILRKRNIKSDNIVKCSVDINEKMFPSEFKNSFILIFPFLINFKRGFKFIKHCKKNYPNSSLMGVKYPLSPLIKAFLIPKKRDFYITQFEFQGKKNLALQLEKMQLKNIYCSDDFEKASFVTYNYLIKKGIKVINKAHALNFDCLFNNYSTFKVINKKLEEHYIRNNKDINYEIDNFLIQGNLNNIIDKKTEIFSPYLLIIDQGNFRGLFHLEYEAKLQELLLEKANEFGAKQTYPVYIKPHPNRIQSEFEEVSKKYKYIKPIKQLNEIKENNPVHLNLFSNAFYDFFYKGPVIFLADSIFNPSIYFGDQIIKTNIEELNETMDFYCKKENWFKYYDSDIL